MSDNITSATAANTNTPTSTSTTTLENSSKSNYYNPSSIHNNIYNNNNNNNTTGSIGPTTTTTTAATATTGISTTNTDSGKSSVSSISTNNSIFSEAPEANPQHYCSHPPYQHFPFMTNNNHHHHNNANVGGIPASGYPFPQPNASPTTTTGAPTIVSHSNGTPELQQQQPLVPPQPQAQSTVSSSLPQYQNQIISGTGASTNPPHNPRISAKFNNHDIQILRQLLLAGEKHKWKQITKELNSSTNHNAHIVAAINAAAVKSRNLANNYDSNNNNHNINDNTPTTNLHHSFGYHHLQQQQHSLDQKSLGHRIGNGTTSSSSATSGSLSGSSPSTIPAKNVSPTFVVKQYQQLLGFPNNALYFGTLGSSLPYVVAENGWDDIGPEATNYQF
ncbi:conserved hypothetical protein [Candida dubliniensis CD36]|uniref:Uncharacterized protein n=1 Tax=Candida dubliniensis (strain CD36 / ATCC MYA-646 / CBS 7987 / NCPF 3949 / NRRL Y-17841) TaxID=573826 RepID=B9WGN8_CANDC|nr:conserved hypothetical protein [Candida dubliniensis CD36]CAX42414.1 conserved hypothetical protein [Candida dubliniensis CD36]